MTLARRRPPIPSADVQDDVNGLWAMIDGEVLTLIGWHDQHRVLHFPQAHPLLGWKPCAVPTCAQDTYCRSGDLCLACSRRRRRLGLPLAEFVALPKPLQRSVAEQRCVVPGCRRPWRTSNIQLCAAHLLQRQQSGQSLPDFLARTDLVGHESFGPCEVAACVRDRYGQVPYCQAHHQRLRNAQRADPDLDVARWRVTVPAVLMKGEVSLRGLRPRLVAELIFGVQQRIRAGARIADTEVRPLCDAARAVDAGSLSQVPTGRLTKRVREFVSFVGKEIGRIGATPDVERHKDVWDLTVFGRSGILRFTGISQPWLRAATKLWAADDLPTRRGVAVGQVVAFRVRAVADLSDSLRLQRDDQGLDLAALSRQDITAWSNRQAYLVSQGTITHGTRARRTAAVRGVLDSMRALGLTRARQVLHGLPDDFRLVVQDIPDLPDDSEAGRDLPAEVMQHLCRHLPMLEDLCGREVRVAIELLIDTGRRPEEICRLNLDCLDRDGDGQPVLIYDNLKMNRLRRRLPIPAATAALIVAQQDRVRAAFPHTPDAELKLLPTSQRNPDGRHPMRGGNLSGRHRRWINHLPDIAVPTAVQIGGTTTTKMLPFDKEKISPYAYRHTYAQRHADAGVDVTVLRELMNHRLLSTTQGYYHVGEQRRRQAVERVTVMQFDRHGNRVWRRAQAMLDSEYARKAVGEVAVPYGGCSEPSNVAAAGQDCPVRFRFAGCGHFSTDISYLPDLERYLADLLRHRERLTATLDVDDWARDEAMPSDQEIQRILRLITRMTADLQDLTDEERVQITDAVTVVRQSRKRLVGLGLPRSRQPIPDVRPERIA
ncbi:site-specific integrase [Actinoplanes sp. NPDC049548]|uniref:tyrosine-type recombinase/integrase n=1 Tax=Actinoplanes sp. NPDC049548 TaxID=3155152 RepID=UPI00343592C1